MRKVFSICTICIIMLSACSRVPGTGRRQFTAIPETQLVSMSVQEYNSFLNQSNVVTGTAEAQQVQNAGNKISAAVNDFFRKENMADRINDFKWEYNLVQNNEVNAWCMAGGKIVFYTGIMPYTQNEPGVAVVMGHEVAHAVAKHGNERMSQLLAQQLGGVALDVALGSQPQQTRNLLLTAYGVGSQVGVLLPFSRKQELEADQLGLIFMAMAGYDPNNAVSFWQRMEAAGGGAPPEFLSTHPSHDRRISEIQKYIPKAMKYYKSQ